MPRNTLPYGSATRNIVLSVYADGTIATITDVAAASGGTVTTVSSGDLSPLFTASIGNPTTTPAFTFTATSQNPNLVYAGPTSGGAAAPSFRNLQFADMPQLFAGADLTAQTAAVASVTTLTPTADGTYRVGAYVTVTAISVDVLNVQATWTDETSTARTQTFFPTGATSANIGTVGAFVLSAFDIRVKANTAVTIKTVLAVGGGSLTYDVGGSIEQLPR